MDKLGKKQFYFMLDTMVVKSCHCPECIHVLHMTVYQRVSLSHICYVYMVNTTFNLIKKIICIDWINANRIGIWTKISKNSGHVLQLNGLHPFICRLYTVGPEHNLKRVFFHTCKTSVEEHNLTLRMFILVKIGILLNLFIVNCDKHWI